MAANDPRLENTLGEVTRWFFDDYLVHWASVANGTRQEGPEFILDYWGCPLHISSPEMNQWFTEPRDVVGWLADTQARLRKAGYTHTAVPDSRVTVFHPGGVGIEVIWSRRAGQAEIERLAVDFQAVKTRDGWRVIGIQYTGTSAESLDEIWPVHRGSPRDSRLREGSTPAPRAAGT